MMVINRNGVLDLVFMVCCNKTTAVSLQSGTKGLEKGVFKKEGGRGVPNLKAVFRGRTDKNKHISNKNTSSRPAHRGRGGRTRVVGQKKVGVLLDRPNVMKQKERKKEKENRPRRVEGTKILLISTQEGAVSLVQYRESCCVPS